MAMNGASGPASGHAAIRIHPGLLFMGLLGAAGLLQYWRPIVLPLGPLERHALALTAASFAMGSVIGAWAFVVLNKAGTAVDPKEPTTRLIVRGPYRITRNPLYLAQLLVMFGFTALTCSWWFLGAVPVLAVLLNYLVILPEERYLAGLFGDEFTAYRSKVRRWI